MARLVAITGGTGFLGLHLVPEFARAGFAVRMLARRGVAHPALTGIDIDVIWGGIEDEAALAALVTGADVVVHAAGLIKARSRDEFLRVNRGGGAAIAALTRQYAPQARFLQISSLAAREPRLSPYAFSKSEAEHAVRQAFADAPEQLVILRPPAVYGPWDKETLTLFRSGQGLVMPVPGHSKAAIIHAQDAAEAITALAGDGFRPGCFALADEQPDGYAMRDLMAAAAKAAGGNPVLLPFPSWLVLAVGGCSGLLGALRGEAPIFTLGKAREILHQDWSVSAAELLPREIHRPKISLTEGFAETAEWYRQMGWLPAKR